jgi:hypothetical protein
MIVIPGQTHPPVLFPNMEITSSVIDEGVAIYRIGWHEISQALGVLALVGFLFVLGLKFLKLHPTEALVQKQAEVIG